MSLPVSAVPLDWDAQVSLKLLVESMPIAVVIVDAHGQIVYVNAKLEEMFGYSPNEVLGATVETLMPERYRQSHTGYRHTYVGQPHVRNMGSGMDLVGLRKDGTEFTLEAGLSSLQLEGATYVVTTITDVSKRKQVEQFLAHQVQERTLEVERRKAAAEGVRRILSSLISNRPLQESLEEISEEALSLLAADSCVIFHRDERTGELQSQVIRGQVPHDLENRIVPHILNQRQIYSEPLVMVADSSAVPAFAYTAAAHLTNHGANHGTSHGNSIEPAHTRATLLTVPIRDAQVYGLLLCSVSSQHRLTDQDIDWAMRLADLTVLAYANAHLRTRIEHSAVAAERSRIARDLHDAVTQTLFSASIIAGVLPTIWGRNQEEARRRLAELQELTRGALAEMRTLLLELRPAKLVEVDLNELLRQLAEAISGRARVPVKLDVEGDAEISADVKVAFYRVAQEALNNIAKHAQARHAWITLRRTPDKVTLSVTDDGTGFVFERIAPQHLGLGIMRERADDIGASLSVHSAPNEGTTIALSWINPQESTQYQPSGEIGSPA